jgi:retinol dehydrogenase 12
MKTAVITGASSGIGLVVAQDLAKAGWRVIAHGRDPGRAAAAEQSIRAAACGGDVDMMLADLSIMAEVARFANDVRAKTDKIDVLINNAGFTPAVRVETVDGLEQCFAANHMAPFHLTNLLLPLVKAAGRGAQIINTASSAHSFIKDMKWDDLQQKVSFSVNDAYTQSKLANILHARELARRVVPDGIRVNAVHPGFVQSNFDSHGGLIVKLMYIVGKPWSLTPKQGADTIVWLAKGGAPDVSGEYFVKRKIAKTTPAAQSEESAARLWQISEDILERLRAFPG